MKTKFLYGLGDKKEYSYLLEHFSIPKIDWNKGKINPPIGKVKTLVGFSLGCMVACIHAEKSKVSKLILCSPSPDETLCKVKADEVIFIVGGKENWVIENVKRMAKTLNCDYKIITVPNSKHKIDRKYLKTILSVI